MMSTGEKKQNVIYGDRFPTRPEGIPATGTEVYNAYMAYLREKSGLSGPNNCKTRNYDTDMETYFILADIMHGVKFKPLMIRDEAREADGRNLRSSFAYLHSSFTDYSAIDTPGCSMLEMLLALTERYDSENMCSEDQPPRVNLWFFEFLKNAKLDGYTDYELTNRIHNGENVTKIVEKVLDSINNREYNSDGSDGFFPLKRCEKDQRLEEIWYQIQKYMLENHDE